MTFELRHSVSTRIHNIPFSSISKSSPAYSVKMGSNKYFFLGVCFCLNLIRGSNSTCTFGTDVQRPLLHIVENYNKGNTVVLIYDEELGNENCGDLLEDLHQLNRVVVSMNVGKQVQSSNGTVPPPPEARSTEQALLIRSFLSELYSRGRPGMDKHYTFIIWVRDPSILYMYSSGHHPGWNYHDRVILIYPRSNELKMDELLAMNFWRHIAFIVGLRKDDKTKNINAFTVQPYRGDQMTGLYKNLDFWKAAEGKFHGGGDRLFPEKFSTLNGAKLPIGVIWKEPFLIWGSKLHPYVDGLDWRLCKLAEKKLNFTTTMVIREQIGRFRNNSWTGLLGLVSEGKIAFALGGIGVTPERRQYFYFPRSYYTDSYTFISPIVTEKINLWSLISKPLKTRVWYSLLGTEIFLVILLTVVANIEKLLCKSENKLFCSNDEWFTRYTNNISFVVSQICQKPCHKFPRSSALRWICNLSSLGTYFLGIVFISHLISNMSQSKVSPSVNKVDNIAQLGYSVEIRDYDSHLNDYLPKNKPELWNGATLVNWLDSIQTIKSISRRSAPGSVIGNRRRIYMDLRSRLSHLQKYIYNKTNIFSFHLSTENILADVNLGWAMQKNIPFHKAIDRVLNRAVEMGLVHYWMANFNRGKTAWDGVSEASLITEDHTLQDWSSYLKTLSKAKPKKPADHKISYIYEQITMKELEGIQALYSYGCFTAALLLVGELISRATLTFTQMIFWLLSEFYLLVRKTFECLLVRRTNFTLNTFPDHYHYLK